MFPALCRLFHAALTYFVDIGIAHLCHSRAVIHAALFFHLKHNMLQHLFFVLLQRQLLQQQIIAFDQFGCRKTHGDPCIFRMIFDQMHHGMDAAVYGAAMIRTVTKILYLRRFLIFCHMHCMMHQLIYAFVLRRRDRYHRHTKHLFHRIDVHIATVADHFIHHIERYHHRHTHLQQLHRQIQVTPDAGHIHDIYDRLGLFFQDKIPGNDLFTGIGGHGIYARQIRDECPLLPAYLPVLTVYRNTREVSHMLVGSGQLVKQRGLAAVLITDQSKRQRGALRQRILRLLFMITSFFSQTRMLRFCPRSVIAGARRGSEWLQNFSFRRSFENCIRRDPLRICKPQGQFIAVYPELHRIPHRRIFYQFNLCPRDQSHIQKMLAESPFSANLCDLCFFALF